MSTQAMATEDHEAAAGYVKRYLDLQARLGQPEPGVAGQGEEQDRVRAWIFAESQLRSDFWVSLHLDYEHHWKRNGGEWLLLRLEGESLL